MPLHILVSVCIWILALCGVLENACKATGISKAAFCFGAFAVIFTSSFQIYIEGFSANAAALFWPLFWSMESAGREDGHSHFYCAAAWTPLFAALTASLLETCVDLFFAPELDLCVLVIEMLFWAAAVYTETLFYINHRKMPVREL